MCQSTLPQCCQNNSEVKLGRMTLNKILLFQSQALNINSLHCLSYITFNVSSENLEMNQGNILQELEFIICHFSHSIVHFGIKIFKMFFHFRTHKIYKWQELLRNNLINGFCLQYIFLFEGYWLKLVFFLHLVSEPLLYFTRTYII